MVWVFIGFFAAWPIDVSYSSWQVLSSFLGGITLPIRQCPLVDRYDPERRKKKRPLVVHPISYRQGQWSKEMDNLLGVLTGIGVFLLGEDCHRRRGFPTRQPPRQQQEEQSAPQEVPQTVRKAMENTNLFFFAVQGFSALGQGSTRLTPLKLIFGYLLVKLMYPQ